MYLSEKVSIKNFHSFDATADKRVKCEKREISVRAGKNRIPSSKGEKF